MSKETGGAALPQSGVANDDGRIFESSEMGGAGMTLRDYFAAKAMNAFIHMDEFDRHNEVLMAQRSYDVADAMLCARSMKNP